MRSKEDAQDYRYFPDPDLPAVVIDDSWLERIRASQPELPAAKRQRYQAEFGLGDYEVSVLTTDPALSALFEQTARLSGRPRDAAAWLMGEFLQAVKARGSRPDELTPIRPLWPGSSAWSRRGNSTGQPHAWSFKKF
jgi:aspartyl-tRNA(Asn)/glutamyl-tRNA(Gln) amidotransferase subunit B